MHIGAIPKNKTVLVLDSGVGGLTIARAIAKRLPCVNLHYLADDASFPYGDWRKDDLVKRLIQMVGSAHAKIKADACVIACNTASTLALGQLRYHFPFPIVGTVPAIKPAVTITKSKKISVLATPATANSAYLRELIKKLASDVEVRVIATPHLAQIAEDHIKGKPINRETLHSEIIPAFVGTEERRTDSIVLGCTHYPLILEEFKLSAPWAVNWLDPANGVANQLMRVLYPSSFKWGPKPLPRKLTFHLTSGDSSPDLQDAMRELCQIPVLSSPENHLKKGAVTDHLLPVASF